MLLRYLPIKTLLRLWSQVSLKDLSRRVHALSYHFLEPLHVCMYTYICIYIYIYIYKSYFRDFFGVAKDVSFFRLWSLLRSPCDPVIGRALDYLPSRSPVRSPLVPYPLKDEWLDVGYLPYGIVQCWLWVKWGNIYDIHALRGAHT
jgi:hypothetical protein